MSSCPTKRPVRIAATRVAVLAASLWFGVAHAGLFDDDEARKAILDLRQRIEAGRQSSDAGLQRLLESQTELARRGNEENAQLRRSLVDLQNQIEALRADVARLNGQNEQASRDLTELQRRQKDLAQGQQEFARQFEPAKVTVDGREFTAEPAEKRAFEGALASFRSGDFAAAQSAFLALLSRYPKTGYGPSALFWLGNAQYATRDYKEAIINFRILLSAAPDHPKAPEALLSIANCQVELKDLRGARKSLEDLGKNYPQSEAAAAGKERLARLR